MITEHQIHVITTFGIAITLLIGLLIMGRFLGKSIQKAEKARANKGNRRQRRVTNSRSRKRKEWRAKWEARNTGQLKHSTKPQSKHIYFELSRTIKLEGDWPVRHGSFLTVWSFPLWSWQKGIVASLFIRQKQNNGWTEKSDLQEILSCVKICI